MRNRSLFSSSLKSHRIGSLGFGIGLAITCLATAASYVAAAKALHESVAVFGKSATPIARTVQFLTGPPARLDTVAGYESYKIFGSVALVIAIYAAIQGAQIIRGSETKGLVDLWMSLGKSRIRILVDRVAAFFVALLCAALLIYLGTAAGGASANVSLAGPAIGQTVMVVLVALFAFAGSLFLSQFFSTPQAPAGIASAYVVASYFLANCQSYLGGAGFLTDISPFHYYLESRTLVPGTAFNVGAAAVLVIACAVLLYGSWLLYGRRDTDGTILAGRNLRPASYSFREGAVARRTMTTAWLSEQTVAIACWFVGCTIFAFIEASLVPAAVKLLVTGNGRLAKLIDQAGATTVEKGFLSLLIVFASLIVAGFAVFEISRWARDSSSHRLDVIISQPVGAARYVGERMLALVLATLPLAAGIAIAVWIGAQTHGYSASGDGVVRTFAVLLLLSFGIGGFGLLLVTLLKSSAATGIVGGLLILFFFLTTIASLFSWPSWTESPSVFKAFGTPYISWPAWGDLLYLGLLGIAGAVLSVIVLSTRDRIAS